MSRLFGLSCAKPVHLSCRRVQYDTNSCVSTTDSEGISQSTSPADGWGIGFYRNQGSFIFKKVAKEKKREQFSTISEVISSNIFICHLRYGTIGGRKEVNTHPFRWGVWLFAHQGTVNQFRRIKPRILRKLPPVYKKLMQGNTDSEHCFYLYLSLLRGEGGIKKGTIQLSAAVEGLRRFGRMIAEFQKDADVEQPPELNFLISNGSYLLATRLGCPLYYLMLPGNIQNNTPFYSPTTKLEYQLIPGDGTNRIIAVASEPLVPMEGWQEVPNNRILTISAEQEVSSIQWIK